MDQCSNGSCFGQVSETLFKTELPIRDDNSRNFLKSTVIKLCQYDDNGAHVTLGKAANVALELFYF